MKISVNDYLSKEYFVAQTRRSQKDVQLNAYLYYLVKGISRLNSYTDKMIQNFSFS